MKTILKKEKIKFVQMKRPNIVKINFPKRKHENAHRQRILNVDAFLVSLASWDNNCYFGLFKESESIRNKV